MEAAGLVIAVSRATSHGPRKSTQPMIRLLKGIGVEGDAHAGAQVQHRSRVRRDPTQPNLRQVHLIQAELHDELERRGFRALRPGVMGENITTRGIDLLALPTGTRLHVGPKAIVELTGLRNPCAQLDGIEPGLMAAVLDRDEHGNVIRRAGVMAIVVRGGEVRRGDGIAVELAQTSGLPLAPV